MFNLKAPWSREPQYDRTTHDNQGRIKRAGIDPAVRTMVFATAAPTTGAHTKNEIVFNSNPTAGGKIGWVCTADGTPGTWKAFGVIDA